MKRARVIAASSLAGVVRGVLDQYASHALDNETERTTVADAIIRALEARPEAVALREAWADSPTEATLIIAMREAGGDLEGTLLGAAARLAGLAVVK